MRPIVLSLPKYPTNIPVFPLTKGKWASKSEHYTYLCLRNIYENKFDFKTIRPTWLINPQTNCSMEIDFYNADLKLAVEYNGIQHYEYTPRFHKSIDDFKNQLFRDKIKKLTINRIGLNYIVIPHTVPVNNLQQYIYKNLTKFY